MHEDVLVVLEEIRETLEVYFMIGIQRKCFKTNRMFVCLFVCLFFFFFFFFFFFCFSFVVVVFVFCKILMELRDIAIHEFLAGGGGEGEAGILRNLSKHFLKCRQAGY